MKLKLCIAATLLCAGTLAQATTRFGEGNLSEGVNTLEFGLTNTPGPIFQEDVLFSLGSPSKVTGTLTGLDGSIGLQSVRAQRFSEMGTAPIISAPVTTVGGVSTFDLGELWAPLPTTIGFESGLYTLVLSGQGSDGFSGLKLTLNVASIPEPSTWALLALGLIGIAGVQRTRRVLA